MKKVVLIAFLFFGFNSFAQKGCLSVGLGADINSTIGTGAGLQAAGLINAAGPIYLGAGVGVTRFPDLKQPVIPFFGQLAFIPKSDKIAPIFYFQPGFSTYNNKDLDVGRKGFYFSTGAGAKLPSGKGKVAPYLTAGYSSYSFKGGRVRSNFGDVNLEGEQYGCFAIKAGILFH